MILNIPYYILTQEPPRGRLLHQQASGSAQETIHQQASRSAQVKKIEVKVKLRNMDTDGTSTPIHEYESAMHFNETWDNFIKHCKVHWYDILSDDDRLQQFDSPWQRVEYIDPDG